jgi:serine/threonine protein kinase
MPFDPMVGDVVRLFGDQYAVQEHPGARGLAFAAEAGRAIVYQVKDKQGHLWALKVFFPEYRSPQLLESHKHLRAVESYEGLMAASRRIVTPDEGDARTIRDLHYAVLMRWVPGRTWFDLLEMVGLGRTNPPIHPLPVARQLTSRFLKVMDQLESSGVAHTDISAGNVTVEHRAKDTQLLDLEDMYLPRCPRPAVTTPGTPGYSHPNVTSTWEPAGDRYATAVLSAELLLTSNEMLARHGSSSGYFTGHRKEGKAQERFTFAEPYLREVAPGFCKLFVEAWMSDSLASCPRIRQLQEAARKDWSTVLVPTPVADPTLKPEAHNLRGQHGRVWFEQDQKVTFDTYQAQGTAAPKQPQPAANPRVRFDSDPAPRPPAKAPANKPKSPNRVMLWVAIGFLLTWLLIWLANRR